MPNTSIRIPNPGPLQPPVVIPRSATTLPIASKRLSEFLQPQPSAARKAKTLFLTGAGLSTASGLADYRGTEGTYTLNPSYRPIYYHEFLESHASRRRYWARSFLGWSTLDAARPNAAHNAITTLAAAGYISAIITQNVDSFHTLAAGTQASMPTSSYTTSSERHLGDVPIIELHGSLRSLVCMSCHNHRPRADFQSELATLNPEWKTFLDDLASSGALSTEDPEQRKKLGFRTNPDGDVDVRGINYSTFKYPPCPTCLATPPALPDGSTGKIFTDDDGAWKAGSTAGVLKPNVTMFGESIHPEVKTAAEDAVADPSVDRILIIGSSLATYSAWSLVKAARDRGMAIGIINLGGVRKEEDLFKPELFTEGRAENGVEGIRLELKAEDLLPATVQLMDMSS